MPEFRDARTKRENNTYNFSDVQSTLGRKRFSSIAGSSGPASLFACATPHRTIQYRGFTVGVAQMVEPWIVVPVVAGSNPVVHPILASGDCFRQGIPKRYYTIETPSLMSMGGMGIPPICTYGMAGQSNNPNGGVPRACPCVATTPVAAAKIAPAVISTRRVRPLFLRCRASFPDRPISTRTESGPSCR